MKLFATILVCILFIPAALFAETLSLGEGGTVTYNTSKEVENTLLYYQNDVLVASAHDTDINNRFDVWITYRNEEAFLEAHDTDGNDTPDTFFELTQNEKVSRMYGSGATSFEKPKEVTFDSRIAQSDETNEEDLVGDLSSITLPGDGSGFIWLVIILAGAAGVYWWKYRRK